MKEKKENEFVIMSETNKNRIFIVFIGLSNYYFGSKNFCGL